MDKLETWIKTIVADLDRLLFRLLDKDYNYRISDEAVRKSLIANEHDFTKDGKMFNQ